MNKKLLVVLFGFLALATAATQSEEEQYYSIDQAADLLNDLLEDSQQNLSDLQAAWAVKEPILQSIIDGLQSDLDNKTAECDGLDVVLANDQASLQEATDYVAWLEGRIADDTQQIADLLARRCAQNNNYIEGLKNDKVALKLIDFLTQQIQNKEDFSLVQKKAFMKRLTQFIHVYKNGSYEALLQLQQEYVNADDYAVNPDESVHDRSADEIGTGHIDNDQGDIDVADFQSGERQGWYQIKQELLELLANLEATINAKIVQAQADEVDSNSAAADFKLKLEHEIQVYEGQLAKWQQVVVQLTATVADDENNCSVCRQQEAAIQSDLTNAQNELATETATFEHKQSNFQEEIEIFQEVIALYDPNLQQQDDSYKDRVEDYEDNQTFDDASYNPREIPGIDFINSQDSEAQSASD